MQELLYSFKEIFRDKFLDYFEKQGKKNVLKDKNESKFFINEVFKLKEENSIKLI